MTKDPRPGEQTTPTQEQTKRMDLPYAQAVSRFFNKAKQDLGADSDSKVEGYLSQHQNTLERLANPARQQPTQADAGLALAYLGGVMAGTDQRIESNILPDSPDLNEKNGRLFEASKNIFLAAGGKIFGHLDTSPEAVRNGLDAVEKLGRGFYFMGDIQELQDMKEPEQRLKKLDLIIYYLGNSLQSQADGIWNVWQKGDMELDEFNSHGEQIAAAGKELYRLWLMRDELGSKMQKQQIQKIDDKQLEEIRQRLARGQVGGPASQPQHEEEMDESEKQIVDIGPAGKFKPLYQDQKTVEEVVKVVTPEMKALMVQHVLHEIDLGLVSAKHFADANPGSIVNRKSVAQFCGYGVSIGQAPVYQKMITPGSRKIFSPNEVARMPITEYLSYLGYDLRADKKRVELLNRYTNALM